MNLKEQLRTTTTINPAISALAIFVSSLGWSTALLAAPVDFRLTARSAPSGFDTSMTVPASQSNFPLESSIFLEIWIQTTDPGGLSSASLDLSFDPTLVTGLGITPTAVFSELLNGTLDNGVGLIDDLSGSHLGPCTDAVAVSPNWARLAVVEFSANNDGMVLFGGAPTGSVVYGTAICGAGDIDPATITFDSLAVAVGNAGIPAASTWGLIVLSVLIMTAGTLAIGRRRHVRTVW